MDKSRSIKNISVAIIFKVILLFLGIITTRCLIKYAGNEINGVNALFKSIIGFLSIAELGVGTAITYCMYEPIVNGKHDVVAAIYKLIKKIYICIGIIILVAGMAIMPFLSHLAKGYTVDSNIYYTFFLMLVSVILSYFFSAQTSLVNAYKDNYITTCISSIGMIIQQVAQIIVLICFNSFEIFLVCRIFAVLVQWGITVVFVNKKHKLILENNNKIIGEQLQKSIVKNVRAMFLHKIGGVLVNSVDSIIVSACCGVIILGKFSNYVAIMSSMVGLLVLFFTPLTSIIGHLFVENNGGELKKYYNFFHAFNYVLGVIFFLGYYAVIDVVVWVFYGEGLAVGEMVKLGITINYFVQFLRQSTLLFRDATGTFYYDRWKPLCEGMVKVLLSIILILVLPDDFKLVGVLVASISTNVFICHIVEPYVLFKHVFGESPKKFYLKNYLMIVMFALFLGLMMISMSEIKNDNVIMIGVLNGTKAIGISIIAFAVIFLFNSDFRYYIKRIFVKLFHK